MMMMMMIFTELIPLRINIILSGSRLGVILGSPDSGQLEIHLSRFQVGFIRMDKLFM